MFQKSATTLRNALSGRWAFGCLLAGALMVATAPSLSAQPITTFANPTRAPFTLVVAGVPAATYTVPNLFDIWIPSGWNWAVSGGNGTNLVLDHIHIAYYGAIGSSLNVNFQACYDQSLAGAAISAEVCPYFNFQTPPVSQAAVVGYPPLVSTDIPVSISIPTATYKPASLTSFQFSVPGGSGWSSTPPAGSSVVISGHFEPLGLQ